MQPVQAWYIGYCGKEGPEEFCLVQADTCPETFPEWWLCLSVCLFSHLLIMEMCPAVLTAVRDFGD